MCSHFASLLHNFEIQPLQVELNRINLSYWDCSSLRFLAQIPLFYTLKAHTVLLCSLDVPSCIHCMCKCSCCALLWGSRDKKCICCTLDYFPYRHLHSANLLNIRDLWEVQVFGFKFVRRLTSLPSFRRTRK